MIAQRTVLTISDLMASLSQGFAKWFETSAKENLNINLATETLVQKIIENGQGQLAQDNDGGDGLKVRSRSYGVCVRLSITLPNACVGVCGRDEICVWRR